MITDWKNNVYAIEEIYQVLSQAYADSRALHLGALGALGGLYRFLCLILFYTFFLYS